MDEGVDARDQAGEQDAGRADRQDDARRGFALEGRYGPLGAGTGIATGCLRIAGRSFRRQDEHGLDHQQVVVERDDGVEQRDEQQRVGAAFAGEDGRF